MKQWTDAIQNYACLGEGHKLFSTHFLNQNKNKTTLIPHMKYVLAYPRLVFVYVKNKINIWNVSKIIFCGGVVFFFFICIFTAVFEIINLRSMPMPIVTCVSVARFIPILRWWLCSFHAKYWFSEPEYIEIFSIDAM